MRKIRKERKRETEVTRTVVVLVGCVVNALLTHPLE